MARACDFCKFTNQYICDPDDHCMQCGVGQAAHKQEQRTTKPKRFEGSQSDRGNDGY